MNKLTDAGVLAENKLFATLDPTARALTLPDGNTVLLIDTVGSSLGVWNWANKYKLKTRKIELKLLRKRKKVKKQVDSNE